nr:MFS transporter [Aeromicrobium stalagmiti]
MVAVMALTPVHMEDHGAALKVIGLTISLHIAGMFALSPVMGWLSDSWGHDRTILLGQSVLVLAVFVAGTSGSSEVQITIGLTLLGIGWSASVIAGAAKLTASLDVATRPLVQGLSDLTMNLAGALGGLLAGLVVAISGFGTLNAAAAVLTIPVVVLILSGRRVAARIA